ncbi:ABC transporter substrate-binding protein [Beijerinckia indica]|uniref:ABC-type nitrate/sulfonate/bicarbonate transport systems periplasmic components-like protein n=1 Tax=Beijerinckia indica subsp. indica (strain ATCC 9039 / DSM 1715 / NCIMB 8712) TaxID=395963 RepID=B2IGE0_BEII9|nr:ABC transporter substrate-binding protein [Beijerinckia indica]ACB94325.1 ABC-type nitrate/sulfonate/bicarbonate transport systems periplasmic components-like protein [Beijerinckia indica subsp. indica ATCC 9039]
MRFWGKGGGKGREKQRCAWDLAALALALGMLLKPVGLSPVLAAEVLPSINLQLSPWTVIAEEKGFFSEEFDKIGTKKINLVAPGAAELLGAEAAAVNGGAIAVAQRMIYPATVHKANGLDGVVIWVSEPSNRYRAPILARSDNESIKNVQDLDGKKFGSSRISCYWSSPFEILTKASLPFDAREKKGRVRYESIDNSTVAVAAVLSGATDATSAHLAAGAFTGAWLSGKLKVIGRSPDDGVYVNDAGRVTYFARRDFVNKYPEVVEAFLAAREHTREWTFDHVDEAAAIIARRTRVPLDVAKFQITHAGEWEFMAGEPNADRARQAIKAFQGWYVANGDDILSERRLSDEQVDAFIDGRFFVGGSHSIYH